MKTEDNSYEEYKKYLQNSLGISSLQLPKHPMNPYMRFYLERSSEERSKGNNDWNAMAKTIALEWKDLAANKKEYYQKLHTIRMRERNALMQEFLKLSGKQKILAPYARFVKKRYAQYSKQHKNSTSVEINKLVKNDWKNLSQKEKAKWEDEYQKQKNDASLDLDKEERIAEYNQRLQKYHENLIEDKEKILKKFGITKESKAKLKREEREQERLRKRAQRQLQREQRKRQKQQQKRKLREAKLKKLRQLKEAQKKLKEEEKQKEKEAKQKAKAEEAERKKQENQNKKKKKPIAVPAVKVSQEVIKPKSKAKTIQKNQKAQNTLKPEKVQPKKLETKKSQKSKKIKKAKETKKEKEAVKAQPKKQKSKPKAKAKKGKAVKGAKRGKK